MCRSGYRDSVELWCARCPTTCRSQGHSRFGHDNAPASSRTAASSATEFEYPGQANRVPDRWPHTLRASPCFHELPPLKKIGGSLPSTKGADDSMRGFLERQKGAARYIKFFPPTIPSFSGLNHGRRFPESENAPTTGGDPPAR